MNVAKLFKDILKEGSSKEALVFDGKNSYTYQELGDLISKYQKLFVSKGIKPGDKIVFMTGLSVELYAGIIATLALGAGVLMIEPWMPNDKISTIVTREKPRFYVYSTLGFLIGAKNSSLRKIPTWIKASSAKNEMSAEITYEDVQKDSSAMIAYTSGTTGTPKGVNRTHGILFDQVEVFKKRLVSKNEGDELTMFPSFVLGNMASFKTSVIVPPSWERRALKRIDQNCKKINSLTTAPAFLKKILDENLFMSLKEIHLGGALCDVSLVEKALKRGLHVSHVYGSSEAEPVSICDARLALQKSKDKGYFQLTYLGEHVSEVDLKISENDTLVTGGHVSKLYLNDEESNKKHKHTDENGVVWHSMGDRLVSEDDGLWFKGRSGDLLEDFELEQRIYSELKNTSIFIRRREGNHKDLICDKSLKNKRDELAHVVSKHDICDLKFTKIIRDKRHRSRIDRVASLAGAKSW